MSADYFHLSNGAKNQVARDLCRITGCAPIKGRKTTREEKPRSQYFVVEGRVTSRPLDRRVEYFVEGHTRNGTSYRRLRKQLIKEIA